MSIEHGSTFPYTTFRQRYKKERPSPVVWHGKNLADALSGAEHTEYGSITLSTSGGAEVVPGVSMTFQVVQPGGRTTPHMHAWWHLYLVQSGTGSAIFDGSADPADLNPGDVVRIPAWVRHHFENSTPDTDLVLMNVSNLPQQAALDNVK